MKLRTLIIFFQFFGQFAISQTDVNINFIINDSKTNVGAPSCLCTIKNLNRKHEAEFVISNNSGEARLTFTDQPSQYLIKVQKTGYFSMDYLLDLESVPLNERYDFSVKVNLDPIGNAKASEKKGDIDAEADYLYETTKS